MVPPDTGAGIRGRFLDQSAMGPKSESHGNTGQRETRGSSDITLGDANVGSLCSARIRHRTGRDRIWWSHSSRIRGQTTTPRNMVTYSAYPGFRRHGPGWTRVCTVFSWRSSPETGRSRSDPAQRLGIHEQHQSRSTGSERQDCPDLTDTGRHRTSVSVPGGDTTHSAGRGNFISL